MTRIVLACALLGGLAQSGLAETLVSTSETRIVLTVAPMPAPTPALRYLLLPEFEEQNPGNPCLEYLKCFLGQERFFFDVETTRRRDQLLRMPLSELPTKELHQYGGPALVQADWAARLDTPDWQVLLKLKREGPAVLLPEVQQLDLLADGLKTRLRGEVASGRFEDAIRTLKTLFALSRHLGDHPTLVGNLKGIAIANRTMTLLDEMLEQPGCPNLYWALTNLPQPLVSIERGLSGERDIFLRVFRDLDDQDPMSDDRIRRFITPLDGFLDGSKTLKPGWVRTWLDEQTNDANAVSRARKRLMDHGIPPRAVSEFPADQVILLDEKREYEVRRDEIFKLLNLPIPQANQLAAKIKPSGKRALFADPFLEALLHINWPQARLEQRVAILRHVEAARLYAAANKGKLPGSLADFTVPLPVDPFTSQPFRYSVRDGVANIQGTPPPGEEESPPYNIRYEVRLKK